jgi:hypothetical protein
MLPILVQESIAGFLFAWQVFKLEGLPCGTSFAPGAEHRYFGGVLMKDTSFQLAPREKQIAELLLQGCENDEIGKQLKIARRTVKAHFNRLFVRFGIKNGIKRVKLATLLYRRQLCLEGNGTEKEVLATGSTGSSNSSPRDLRTATSPVQSEPPNTLSKTTSEPSMTNWDSGTGLNLPSGTKRAGTKTCSTPDLLESWERRALSLKQAATRNNDLN